jgi:hypothetical protein
VTSCPRTGAVWTVPRAWQLPGPLRCDSLGTVKWKEALSPPQV